MQLGAALPPLRDRSGKSHSDEPSSTGVPGLRSIHRARTPRLPRGAHAAARRPGAFGFRPSPRRIPQLPRGTGPEHEFRCMHPLPAGMLGPEGKSLRQTPQAPSLHTAPAFRMVHPGLCRPAVWTSAACCLHGRRSGNCCDKKPYASKKRAGGRPSRRATVHVSRRCRIRRWHEAAGHCSRSQAVGGRGRVASGRNSRARPSGRTAPTSAVAGTSAPATRASTPAPETPAAGPRAKATR